MESSSRYEKFRLALASFLPESALITDLSLRMAYGTDASCYRMVPQLVVKTTREQQVAEVLRLADQMNIPLTFRAAGTSLSGQAVTDSVLLTLGDEWRDFEIKDGGQRISVQPGLIGAEVNRILAPLGRKIGPDPASIEACKIGGIVANNASGMCCGTAQNSYQTLAAMTLLLADGSRLDSGDPQSVGAFRQSHGELLNELQQLAEKTRQDGELCELIRHKYRLKNTTGYSLNALIDFEDPIDILTHLMVGSEGTLGFISEVTYHTVEEHPHKASSLIFFKDIQTTCEAVVALKSAPVAAVELLDRPALRSIEELPSVPELIRELGDECGALLVETRAGSESQLAEQIRQIDLALDGLSRVASVPFTDDPAEYGLLWKIRKGVFPAIGAMRPEGSTVIIEDIAVPVEKLGSAVLDLQQLFVTHGYPEAVIYGHALEGNLHFVFFQSFDSAKQTERYSGFLEAVSQLVAVKYRGSLKAEHGTGRNMAPFVELEWGARGYQLMWQLKQLLDPRGILNPDVVLSRDQGVHLKQLKAMPLADELVDKCIECGFCEAVCPSRDLSMTPRQRITLWREIQQLHRDESDLERLRELEKSYQYQAIETCAMPGLCADRCPMGINTAELMKKLKARQHGSVSLKIASWTADHFATVSSGVRGALSGASLLQSALGNRGMEKLSRGARYLSGDRLGQWLPEMPKAARFDPGPQAHSGKDKVVYLPSCVSRTMGPAKGSSLEPLIDKTLALLNKAGFEVIFPEGVQELCCGMPYGSKGFPEQSEHKQNQLQQALLKASNQGEYPIYMDTSPCSLKSSLAQSGELPLKIYEPFSFIYHYLVPRLEFTPIPEPVMLHVTCSSRRKGLAELMRELTRMCASEVIEPSGIDCCGWGGDKGFNRPELNESALRHLKQQVPQQCRRGYPIAVAVRSASPVTAVLSMLRSSTWWMR
ncbi:FAD-binding and (Fe-S)-binding domain-containing protein [Dongshaea marina]|uniref:FAD-binding and (Fe-S)-binding domain-containing protein n=1 Tax=Dongshaea marina TaxID=2047966 RepID=UPI002D77CA17|nr:FAD-binding and (Fe-S)-binding domain-containing protein [Dongshaea marina]